MLKTAIVVLCLTITTTAVSGDDCECEYNHAQNDFYGDQRCFTAFYQIRQNWDNHTFDIDDTMYRNTLCNGNCGSALNRILHYYDGISRTNIDREVSTTFINYIIHIDIYLNM